MGRIPRKQFYNVKIGRDWTRGEGELFSGINKLRITFAVEFT